MPVLEEELAVLGRRLVTRGLLALAASAVTMCHHTGPHWLRLAFMCAGAVAGVFYMTGAFVCAVFPKLVGVADVARNE